MKNKPRQRFIEPFFSDLVSVYFDFCREKFDEDPSFDGSAPRDLKSIIKQLRQRAEVSKIEWNLETAQSRLHNFLSFCYQDNWLKNNWILFNINRHKDKIFFNIRAAVNRHPNSSMNGKKTN